MPTFRPAIELTMEDDILSDGNAYPELDRRRFLGLCGKVALLGALPVSAFANQSGVITTAEAGTSGVLVDRTLRLLNTHTGERLTATYCENGQLLPDALAEINRILRDHRTDEIKTIDTNLLDFISSLARRVDSQESFHVISGYRSPATNEKLRRQSSGVARRSYHLEGKAVDLKLPGVTTANLRAAALGERSGGVGHYPRSGFVHVDTGPVRSW